MRQSCSRWIETNLKLPEGVSALPGTIRLWPYQPGIADAISDPLIERVTLVKPVRVEFTTLLTGAIGSYVINEPSPILALLPTEADARDYMVSDIEPIFDASPVLRGALGDAEDEGCAEHQPLSRRFAGGKLRSWPRNRRGTRRHTARILIVDEADAMDVGAEGSPIKLGEKRTQTFANRKIIVGSTPVFIDTSDVLKAYAESDRRVFEVRCPACGVFTEIMWEHIVWPEGRPQDAAFKCPHCAEQTPEIEKAGVVARGRWRITQPEVVGHAGFRLNALVSLAANATWAQLAQEFLAAKGDRAELQVFVNTSFGQGWSTPAMISEDALAARAEPFDLNDIPKEVLILTAGGDVQDDRVEISICGWTREGECLILGHIVVWGSFAYASTWEEVDEVRRTKCRHPFGGLLKIDAAVIDAGDGDHYDHVMSFCVPKIDRRIFAGKGLFGARPSFTMAKGKKIKDRLALIGVDTLKNIIFDRLQRGRGIRFRRSLEPVYYEQLAPSGPLLPRAADPALRAGQQPHQGGSARRTCLFHSRQVHGHRLV